MRACARESKRERACDKTFLKRKKMYGKEIGSERASNQKTEKIRLLFSRERERERESFRGFSAAKNRERRSRWCCACGRSRALLSAVRVLRVHARSRVKKQGFFSRKSTTPLLSTCSTGPRRKVHTVRALLLDGCRVSERAFTLRRRRRENLRSRRLSNMYIAATDTLL